MDIDLGDTTYGRQIAVEKQNAKLAIDHMDGDELEEMERQIIIAKAAKEGTNNMHAFLLFCNT